VIAQGDMRRSLHARQQWQGQRSIDGELGGGRAGRTGVGTAKRKLVPLPRVTAGREGTWIYDLGLEREGAVEVEDELRIGQQLAREPFRVVAIIVQTVRRREERVTAHRDVLD